jgi:hypothetical protein
MVRIVRKRTTFIFDLIGSYEYERCSLQANSSTEEATTARKLTTAGTLTTTETARNAGNTSERRDLTAVGTKEGRHSRD